MIPAVNLVTDAAIASFLAVVPVFVILTVRSARSGRNVGFRPLLAFFGVVLWLVAVYGSFIEPYRLEIRTYPVTVGSGDAVLRVAVVSDVHLGLHKGTGWAEKVVGRVNSVRPDLVLLAGDLVSVPSGMESFGPFGELESRYGTYVVLGNWDYRVGAVDVRHCIESRNAEVLTNETVMVGEPGREIALIGLDDWIYGDPDWGAALVGVPDGAVTVAVGHEPDIVSAAEVNGIDLVISGHTHGGQVRLPLIGAVPHLPIGLPQDFDRGLFDYGQTKLFISPGVGESGTRIRFLQPPEISVLEIRY
ncbi:metallophosphoesterase [Candidatus Uhrbacteria bacterium]|nr:metallophosphoesterase [Candidatus Uhrbacteria bacterium]